MQSNTNALKENRKRKLFFNQDRISRIIDSHFTYSKIKRGKVILAWGPMFSGKTSTIIETGRIFRESGLRVVFVKSDIDDRYQKREIVSHDDKRVSAFSVSKLTTNIGLSSVAVDADVVLIDEGQFFDDIAEFCQLMAANKVTVIVAALKTSHTGDLFPNVASLLPVCNAIVTLKGLCRLCDNESMYTQRTTKTNNLIEVGVSQYRPLCRMCWLRIK